MTITLLKNANNKTDAVQCTVRTFAAELRVGVVARLIDILSTGVVARRVGVVLPLPPVVPPPRDEPSVLGPGVSLGDEDTLPLGLLVGVFLLKRLKD